MTISVVPLRATSFMRAGYSSATTSSPYAWPSVVMVTNSCGCERTTTESAEPEGTDTDKQGWHASVHANCKLSLLSSGDKNLLVLEFLETFTQLCLLISGQTNCGETEGDTKVPVYFRHSINSNQSTSPRWMIYWHYMWTYSKYQKQVYVPVK